MKLQKLSVSLFPILDQLDELDGLDVLYFWSIGHRKQVPQSFWPFWTAGIFCVTTGNM
jgi:hypothetical protein